MEKKLIIDDDKLILACVRCAKLKGIYIDHINGYHEHLHALISFDNCRVQPSKDEGLKSREK